MKKSAILSLCAMFGMVLLAANPCCADSLSITYFTMASNDPDATHSVGYNALAALGPNGLPVANNNALNDLDGSNEITWWDPALDPFVTETGTATLTVPFNKNMYTPNGTGGSDGGANGYQLAVLTGTFDVPSDESVTFGLGSDDDSFLYVDGSLVASLPGIHGDSQTGFTTSTLSTGEHSIEIFFADRNPVGAELSFSIDSEGIDTDSGTPFDPSPATPEPGTLMLLGTGLIGAAMRWRKTTTNK